MRSTPPVRRYVALLRGINVGGRNVIRMAELKSCFERHGLSAVSTYIQSGNVLFSSTEKPATPVADIEAFLRSTFGYDATVVLRSAADMRRVLDEAPDRFGRDPETFRYDVIFLREPLDAETALAQVPVREGVDDVQAGPGVLYCSRLAAQASRSRLNRLPSLPIYGQITIRNWRTTTRLVELLRR